MIRVHNLGSVRPVCGFKKTSDLVYRAGVVAVCTVSVMQVPVDQVIHMVAVRHGLVSTAVAVLVACTVGTARVVRGTVRGVCVANRQLVLVHVGRVGVVKMTIVQIVGMAIVAQRQVAAAFPVDVFVTFVPIAGHK